MRVRRPRSKRKQCAHCHRSRLAKHIEWHGGTLEWQCSDFSSCNAVIEEHARRVRPTTARKCWRCKRRRTSRQLGWNRVSCDWVCMDVVSCNRNNPRVIAEMGW